MTLSRRLNGDMPQGIIRHTVGFRIHEIVKVQQIWRTMPDEVESRVCSSPYSKYQHTAKKAHEHSSNLLIPQRRSTSDMASPYTVPYSSGPAFAATNTSDASPQQNNITSVYPRPLHPPNTSSAEYRIWLGFFIFGAISAAIMVIMMLWLCALSSGVARLARRKREEKDEQKSLASEYEMHERVREPERVFRRGR